MTDGRDATLDSALEQLRELLDPTDTCPVPGCHVGKPPSLLMCRRHWLRVARPLRDAVFAAYREQGVLSQDYLDAAREAIREAGT